MKFKNILLFTIAIISIISCEKHNHDNEEEGFEYHAHINKPDSETKHIGQELPINITFESHSGKTIHHINVSIYEKTMNLISYITSKMKPIYTKRMGIMSIVII